jgi:hypothetical protein
MQIKPAYSLVLAAAGFIAVSAGALNSHAQSADALIDKLVDKGILTVDEAQGLRDEADKDFTRTLASKNGMPEWVKTIKLNGDFRGRYEGFYANEPGFVNRDRLRYRLRFGITAGLTDSFEVGLRLGSGDATASNGQIDPISTNQTLDNNGAKKGIYLDQAYVRWKGINTSSMQGSLTFGKMENPLVFSDMVFDADYTPEGLGLNYVYNLSEAQALKFNAGAFSLKEVGSSSNDSFLFAAQVRWDAAWNEKFQTSMGASLLGITGHGQLRETPATTAKFVDPTTGKTNTVVLTAASSAVPNINSGNTRSADGRLAYSYNPYVLDASATYSLESVPLYPGTFPIKVAADYMQNPGAPSDRNSAWSVGLTFGKSGKKGLWDVGYRYKVLDSDAWYEEVVDSDFGAFNSGAYRSGTNVRGHILKANYSPYDFMTVGVTWFLTDAITASPAGAGSAIQRLQVDANFKF